MGVPHLHRQTDVEGGIVVENVEKGGCQIGGKMFDVGIQIQELYVAEERHPPDLGVERISISSRIELSQMLVGLKTNLRLTHST